MTMKPGLKDLLWLAAEPVIVLVVMLGVLFLHEQQNPAARLAFKAKRVELVEQMRLALALASEAANNTVMAVTHNLFPTKTPYDVCFPAVLLGNCSCPPPFRLHRVSGPFGFAQMALENPGGN